MKSKLSVIGRNALVELVGHTGKVPAKVDTGADSSAVWASGIKMDGQHRLHFYLFDKHSPYYTGKEIIVDDYSVSHVRSSSGHVQVRYRARLSVRLGDHRVKASFTLANRGELTFPVLIGRRTLANRFVVDVTQAECDDPKTRKTNSLNKELVKDPSAFHRKYHKNSGGK